MSAGVTFRNAYAVEIDGVIVGFVTPAKSDQVGRLRPRRRADRWSGWQAAARPLTGLPPDPIRDVKAVFDR